jgi:hypothetical protein
MKGRHSEGRTVIGTRRFRLVSQLEGRLVVGYEAVLVQ